MSDLTMREFVNIVAVRAKFENKIYLSAFSTDGKLESSEIKRVAAILSNTKCKEWNFEYVKIQFALPPRAVWESGVANYKLDLYTMSIV